MLIPFSNVLSPFFVTSYIMCDVRLVKNRMFNIGFFLEKVDLNNYEHFYCGLKMFISSKNNSY